MIERRFGVKGGKKKPKRNARGAELNTKNVGLVLNVTAEEAPHFFREVGDFGGDAQRRSGDFSFPARSAHTVETELSGGSGAEEAPGHPGRGGWMRG